MCTVSWVHTADGYHLFCNRDEKKNRAQGLGPKLQARGWVRFVAPVDTEFGGTWIAVNEFGVSACLLNGANLTRRFVQNPRKAWRSRGVLLRELIWAQSADECILWLKQLDLRRFAPFTVAFLQPQTPAVVAEWDGENTTVVPSGDSLMPLTSSSYDPEGVHTARWTELERHAAVFGQVDPAALYAFHTSHCEVPDAYSPCMHRVDAETVSFSWITVTEREIRFIYVAGAPCAASNTEQQVLRRAA